MLFVLRFREINIGGISHRLSLRLTILKKLGRLNVFCTEKILKLLFTQLKNEGKSDKKVKKYKLAAFAKT